MAKQPIPVYLFTGFLESGKTSMAQNFLTDPEFNDGSKILLLLCEEGMEEYDPSAFSGDNVRVMPIEKEEELTPELLADYAAHHKVDIVLVEYNGMWQLNTLYGALPMDWVIAQQLLFVDTTTAISYNANMRSLMVDKLQNADTVLFNRAKGADREELHRLVRGISRRAQIVYENTMDSEPEFDDIEDPLPFDKEASVITVADEDYALFYRDLSDDMPFYEGKTVKFKGMVARDRELGKKALVVGRHVMTCCEEDIAYNGVVCNFKGDVSYKTGEWIVVTAKIKIMAHKMYGQPGPVLFAEDVAMSSQPKQPVATFY